MAEEAAQAPAEGQDTPTNESAPQVEDTREPAAPEETGHAADEQAEIDYRKRYEDLRPEFDRTKAELKQASQYQQVVEALQSDDPQERAWAADILGLEFDGEEDDDGPDDEGDEEFRDPRVDQLLQEKQEQEREQYLASLEQSIDSQIDALDKEHKVDLDDDEKEVIFAVALSLPPGEDGQPDVKTAFTKFTGIADNRIKKYRESKKGAPSPPAAGGSPGSSQVDLSDRRSRLDYANQVAERALQRER